MAEKLWDKELTDIGDCDMCGRKDVKVMCKTSYDPWDGTNECDYEYCYRCRSSASEELYAKEMQKYYDKKRKEANETKKTSIS